MDIKINCIKKNDKCSICLSPIYKKIITTCNHSYCFHCIKNWLEIKKNCPICRKNFQKKDVIKFSIQYPHWRYQLSALFPKTDITKYNNILIDNTFLHIIQQTNARIQEFLSNN